MKNVMYEVGMFILSFIPIAIVTKDNNGVSRIKTEAIHVVGTLIAWLLIALIVGGFAIFMITHDLSKDYTVIKDGIVDIKEQHIEFHKTHSDHNSRIDKLEQR